MTLRSGKAHTVRPGEGQVADMGAVQMRVLAAGDGVTDGTFTLAEFTGAAGAWTVPHLHRAMEESFFVLDGEFTFTVGEEEVEVGPGSYLLVPRGTRHMINARAAVGRLLTLMVPGGNEEMFLELSRLAPGALTDPAVRAEISARYDSVPA
jgi:mannose-6-phosphate isomerase-like protein (cupin superfamily)